MFDYLVVGFSGSRTAPAAVLARAEALARTLAPLTVVATGDARGIDTAAAIGDPHAVIFLAEPWRRRGLPWVAALARRSVEFVDYLAFTDSCLVSFPCRPYPAGLLPSKRWPSGFGSGTWQTTALAVGLGVPVFLYGPSLPPWPGYQTFVSDGLFSGFWKLEQFKRGLFDD